MVDWNALPADVLECISSCITYDADFIRFRAVCTSWRSATAAAKRLQLPWLAVRYRSDNFVGLCNFPNPHVYIQNLPEEISGLEYMCMASPGWIARQHYNRDKHAPDCILLYNPFTGVHIPLPISIDSADEDPICPGEKRLIRNIQHIVLSSDPRNCDCVIMAFCFERWLIRCKPGDSSWTLISPPDQEVSFIDMTYYNGWFYAICSDYDNAHRFFVCDKASGSQLLEIVPVDRVFPEGEDENENDICSTMVVSSGDLLLVACSTKWERRCKVFRIDFDGGQLRLFKVENLADRALFLGLESLSISVGNSTLCKKNCIYEIERTYVRAFSMDEGGTSVINVLSGEYWESSWITPGFSY